MKEQDGVPTVIDAGASFEGLLTFRARPAWTGS